MNLPSRRFRFRDQPSAILFGISCLACLSLGETQLLGQQPPAQPQPVAQPDQSQATPNQPEVAKIPNDQLDSLVAPIALYPDPLLAQILAASTYPLEVIQLEQWLKRNPNLKDKALADAVAKQPWDPSIQAMAVFPEVVTRLSENVAWTTDLGNAFLAQQQDVMGAVQRMRAKAQGKGALKTTEQQKVETETVEGGQQVIVIEPANPQYVYVPSYDPAIVYGPPAYPYPPYYYPGYVPGMGLAFGAGLVLGAAWANNWGDCHWGHGGGDITINNNNNFNRNNVNNINRGQQGGNWQHNATHRGGAPYGDRNTANKYGGRARQQPAGGAGNRPTGGAGNIGSGNRPGGGAGNVGSGNRPGGGAGNVGSGNRPGGGVGNAGSGNRPGGGGSNAGGGNRPGGGAGNSVSTRPSGGGGGADRVGSREVSRSSGGNAFGSSGGGMNRSSATASHNRGSSSMSRGGGGGGGRGGGGGGGRGGGGGGRR